LIDRNRHVFVLNVEAQPVEQTHIDISDPDERKPGNQVPPPTFKQHLEAKYPKSQRGNIVRETVLACKEVEEFFLRNGSCLLALTLAELPRFAKDLFVRHGP